MTLHTSWNKSCTEFINKFFKLVDTYNGLCTDDEQKISEQLTMTLLQHAVVGVKALADVKAWERHAIAEGRDRYTLQVYLDLLKDEALMP